MAPFLGVNVPTRVSFDSVNHEEDDGSCRESIAQLQRTQWGKNQFKWPQIKNWNVSENLSFSTKKDSIFGFSASKLTKVSWESQDFLAVDQCNTWPLSLLQTFFFSPQCVTPAMRRNYVLWVLSYHANFSKERQRTVELRKLAEYRLAEQRHQLVV